MNEQGQTETFKTIIDNMIASMPDDAYCARSAKIKGDWKSDPNSPNNLSRKKWKCRGSKSMK